MLIENLKSIRGVNNVKKPFGLSVRAVILDKSGRCLLLKRSASCRTNVGKWELPGGKTESGEQFDEALIREVAEETGLKISIERAVGIAESELPTVKVIHLILETSLESGQVRISSEHDDYAWVTHHELPTMDMVEEFKPFARMYSRKDEQETLDTE